MNKLSMATLALCMASLMGCSSNDEEDDELLLPEINNSLFLQISLNSETFSLDNESKLKDSSSAMVNRLSRIGESFNTFLLLCYRMASSG